MEQLCATVSLEVYKCTSHQVFTRVHSWQTCQMRRPAEQACAVCTEQSQRRCWGAVTMFSTGHCSKSYLEMQENCNHSWIHHRDLFALLFAQQPSTNWSDFVYGKCPKKDQCPKFCREWVYVACHHTIKATCAYKFSGSFHSDVETGHMLFAFVDGNEPLSLQDMRKKHCNNNLLWYFTELFKHSMFC